MNKETTNVNEELDFIAAVLEGLKAIDEGRVISHKELKARFRDSLKKSL